jgi:hypothetical protein
MRLFRGREFFSNQRDLVNRVFFTSTWLLLYINGLEIRGRQDNAKFFIVRIIRDFIIRILRAVHCEDNAQLMNTSRGRSAKLLDVKLCGTYSNHFK